MADAKITQLAALTSATTDDILPIVDSPGSSPVTKKITTLALRSLTNAITPTAVSGNTNNWNPTGLSTATLIRYSTSGAGSWTLTGLVAQENGRRIYLHNRGTGTLTLASLSASSTAANRFLCPNNVDLVMPEYATRELVYSSAADGYWLVLGAVA